GLEEIRAAKADGRWDAAYAPQKTAGIPPDFAAALTRNTDAETAFGELGKSEQYAVVLPLLKATTPAVRADRLLKAIARLAS
ncbi:MAG: YdeI/OmpD-associated family protein, partial [Fibrobacteria bacterium]